MCGRFACYLGKCHFQKACSYLDSGGNLVLPKFISCDTDYYIPKYNMAPTSTTLVLVNANKLSNCNIEDDERVLCEMRWGLTAPWKNNEREPVINNCRGESILEKPLFSRPFSNGQRCVVPVNGFYEWQSKSGHKQPYFIHAPSESNVQWADFENEDDLVQFWDPKVGWSGPNLLKMAGIFTENEHKAESNKSYSYSIVTIGSEKPFSDIHNRVPVILATDAKVKQWLNTGSIGEAVSLIKAPQKLEWYRVSSYVGNSRNQGHECLKISTEEVEPVVPKTPKKTSKKGKGPLPGQRPITNFFQKSPAKSMPKDGTSSPQVKKLKLED